MIDVLVFGPSRSIINIQNKKQQSHSVLYLVLK